MDRFRLYAQYYDILYQDKDYRLEANYVAELIRKYRPGATKLLNLGCGTGKHEYELARIGYSLTGVDISEEMTGQAVSNIPAQLANHLRFLTADIRSVRLDSSFDAVLSLFHVVSYQVTNKDLDQVMETAFVHLEPGGVFIFDCWYGPAVLTDPPVVRIKRMDNADIGVTRFAEPVLDSFENTVDVNYTILINPIGSAEITEIKETHKMRYLFVKEIELLVQNRFKLLAVHKWLTYLKPGTDSWNVVFVLQRAD